MITPSSIAKRLRIRASLVDGGEATYYHIPLCVDWHCVRYFSASIMGFMDFLTSGAVSIVVGGNTGINPCLTLFLVGCIGKMDPTLLNMEGTTMETLLSSWLSLIVLGIFTVLEFVSMCVPVVDQIVDSIMTFVIPIMSVLGSLSTFGLFNQIADEENRQLGVASGALVFFQIIIVLTGIGLALLLHLFKMIVRLFGEGCLTGVMTCLEVTWTFFAITVVIFIRPIAIVVAAWLLFCAGYTIKRKFLDKNDEEQPQNATVDVETSEYVVMENVEDRGNAAAATTSEAVPTTSETVPTTSETVPTPSETMPTASETVPTNYEAVSTNSEAAPKSGRKMLALPKWKRGKK